MSKKFIIIALIVFILFAIPTTLLLVRQQTNVAQKAAEPTITGLKIIGNKKIEALDVDTEINTRWGKYATQVKSDPTIRNKVLQKLVKEALIKNLIQEQKIVTIQSLSSKFTQSQLEEQALKEKVVNSRTVDIATTFLNPSSPTFAQKKQKIISSLQLLKQAAATTSLQEAYNTLKNTAAFDKTITLQLRNKVYPDTPWNKKIITAIFAIHANQITDVVDSGGTFMIAKVTSENNTNVTNFETYLSQKERELVK